MVPDLPAASTRVTSKPFRSPLAGQAYRGPIIDVHLHSRTAEELATRRRATFDEIREQIQALANLYEGRDKRSEHILDMRLEALRMMRLLSAFRPRLIGSVLTGHVRKGSDIDLHVFTDHPSAVTTVLEDQNLPHTVEHKRVRKHTGPKDSKITTLADYRGRRIRELLAARDAGWTAADCAVVQRDVQSIPWREVRDVVTVDRSHGSPLQSSNCFPNQSSRETSVPA